MALEARALFIGRVAASSPTFLSVSCKMRQRNIRKHQVKRIEPKSSPLNIKLHSKGDEKHESQETITGGDLGETFPYGADGSKEINKTDEALSSAEEKNIAIGSIQDGSQSPSLQLEDLVGMIKNAEKNILLLNEARVRAVEDLDKILTEKEDLRAEIKCLEMKLAETDAQIKVALQEKVHVELLKNQLEKLKDEIASRNASLEELDFNENRAKFLNSDMVTRDTSLLEKLSALQKENLVLKDDIQNLKAELTCVKATEQRVLNLEKERSLLETTLKEVESKLSVAEENASKIIVLRSECEALYEKVDKLQILLDQATKQAEQATMVLQHNCELQGKIEKLETCLQEASIDRFSPDKYPNDEVLQQKLKHLEERIEMSDQEVLSLVHLYQESVEEFYDALSKLKEVSQKRSPEETIADMPWEFWSRLLLTIDGLLLEKKITPGDATLLREMTWKKDQRIFEAYRSCKGKIDDESLGLFLNMALSQTSRGLNIIHIAAEMAPIAKVGGLGDVVSGLSKALQRKGHLVEIIVPKYDCIRYDRINDLKEIDAVVESYFEGQMFKNKIWTGTVEGLPVYFIEPYHPARFFWRGKIYGEHDDFKRFSYFCRAALELLHQAERKPDIIHCHDWHTALVAPLYWEIYSGRASNSARICFTCHNFEYQGTTTASDLASCGLDVEHLHRSDRMRDNSAHGKVNPVKGAIVYSNIVTTVSPTYAQEVCAPEGGRGLQDTLKLHSRKFVGILNGIDTDAWNPSTDTFLKVQYSIDEIQGKKENKDALRKHLGLSSLEGLRPLVGCISRLVPQKGVHLIRHAIYHTLELGGQFVLLGSSPMPQIQKEFEVIANQFQDNPHVCLVLRYDEALSHMIYAAADMFIIPSLFEPCGLTQMIAMRYGSVPIARKTGGLNDSVFDMEDESVPIQYRNGFTFSTPNEQEMSHAMERAFKYHNGSPEKWQQLVQKIMRIDFGWDTSAAQYEELYEKAAARAKAAAAAAANRL